MGKQPETCNRIFKPQFEIIQTPVWNSKIPICKTNPPFETETRVENLKCLYFQLKSYLKMLS